MSDCVRSKTAEEYVPDVTPRGNPGNAGTVVATPTLVPSGAQQWMCAATSLEVKPLNVALICIVWAVGSSTMVARPVPGEATVGTSFAPERSAMKVIWFAWTAGADTIRTAIMTNAGEGMSALIVMIFLRRHGEDSRRQ